MRNRTVIGCLHKITSAYFLPRRVTQIISRHSPTSPFPHFQIKAVAQPVSSRPPRKRAAWSPHPPRSSLNGSIQEIDHPILRQFRKQFHQQVLRYRYAAEAGYSWVCQTCADEVGVRPVLPMCPYVWFWFWMKFPC
jgi:hypothetical protein